MKKTTLNIINTVQIQNPCNESWDQMKGDEKRRFCESCSHSVTNLSELTSKEAARLLSKHQEGRLCVRYTMNSEGGVLYKPASSHLSKIRQSTALVMATLLAVIGISQSASADDAKNPQSEINSDHSRQTMGEIAMPLPTEEPTPAITSQPEPHPEVMGMVANPPENKNVRMGDVVMGKVAAPEKR